MIKEILAAINEHDIITIFRHERADGDAFGSQCALALWLKTSFDNKEVYCLGANGKDNAVQFMVMDDVKDDTIASSLAIVLDTANTARIDDKRYQTAQKVIKIDHHVLIESYGDIEYVDVNKSSTCEIVLELIEAHQAITSCDIRVAEYLYKGLITDTLRFSTTNTSASTLNAGARLTACGIDVANISFEMFKVNKNYFQLSTILRQNSVFACDDELAYVYLKQKDIGAYNLDQEDAKDFINEFNKLDVVKIWVLFIEDETLVNHYNVSIRARNLRIDDIANCFNGGGHQQAAGIKCLTFDDIKRLLEMLATRISSQ